MDLQSLFETVRAACSTRTWSLGIELSRSDAVDGVSAADDEVKLRVRTPGRTVAPEVTLYLEYEEWDCACDSSADCCEHVAASIIALRQAHKAGKPLPASAKAGGRIAYRLAADGDRLEVKRVVGDVVLTGSVASILAGTEAGPQLEPSKIDLSIDRLLTMKRVRSHPIETVRALLPLLAEAEDVALDGEAIFVDPSPIAPRALVSDGKAGAFVLRLEPHPDVVRVVVAGLALCKGARLRPLDLVELSGARLERLPTESHYDRQRTAQLVAEVLPRLRERGDVVVKTKRLPEQITALEPRIVLEVEQRGAALMVLPLLVYGEPPCARVDGDKLVHLGGPLPARDRRAEARVVDKLREELDVLPGQRVEYTGGDAIEMAAKLRKYHGAIDGGAHEALYLDEPLTPEIDVAGDGLKLRFASGARGADPAAVLRAWERGENVVTLLDGGWATLPTDWLARFGDRVAALLAAKGADGKVAAYARPALLSLCDELQRPRPPALAGLAPLVDGFERIPEAELPADLNASLRDYQRRGVDWLSFVRTAGLGAVLADDMGLGKTLQTLCALRGRTLVVCPRSVVHNWVDEIRRFRPTLRHAIYHGADRSFDDQADVTLTTYALLRNDIEQLVEHHWDTVVLDESQAIKNPDSKVARAAFRLRADFRVTLSGTPVENRLDELWSQMHFANRGLLGGRDDFRARYEQPIANGVAEAAQRLRARIKPFVLRRLKKDVLSELPPRTEMVMHCELDHGERDIYQAVLAATRDDVARMLDQSVNVIGVLEALLRLRQAACDASLLPGQQLPRASSKVRRLVMALEQAAADGHKALVFSQWTSLLDRIEPELKVADIPFCRLDGSTRDRAGVVAAFQDAGGPPVMLISLKAGGTGLNLTAADHVFLVDPWWNPAVEDQAADRAHRIGQDKPVMVYRMVTKNTVEERIMGLQASKRALAEAALGEAGQATRLTRADLLALIG